jgi:hypothetical protein
MYFFHIVIDENHFYEEAVGVCIEKAKVFLNDNKQNHKLEEIRFYLNDSSIIMEHDSFLQESFIK